MFISSETIDGRGKRNKERNVYTLVKFSLVYERILYCPYIQENEDVVHITLTLLINKREKFQVHEFVQ